MFDVSFSELLVIALVALIVIGPERLPKVARTAGHLLGRLQRYVNDVKSEINREMQLDELRKVQHEVEQSAREVETSVSKELHTVEDALNNAIAPPAAEFPSTESNELVDTGARESRAEAGEPPALPQLEPTLDTVGSPRQNL